MDGVQLPQGYSHFEEAVYFLPFSSQKFLVLILSTSEGWKAESTLKPPSDFDHGTPGLGIQRLNHYAIAPLQQQQIMLKLTKILCTSQSESKIIDGKPCRSPSLAKA